jgi:hypothetical protein
LSTFYLCPEAEFTNNALINLAGEISSHHSIQIVSWILLAPFGQVYFTVRLGSKKQNRRILKLCILSRKGASRKLWTRSVWFLKRVMPLKRSQALFTGQKILQGHLGNWTDTTHNKAPGYKGFN